MIEIAASADPVRLSFLHATLREAGIEAVLFDGSGPWPGALPGRLMVPAADAELARRIVAEAEAGLD